MSDTRVGICVAWRSTPDRQKAWDYVRPHYEATDWPMYEADSGDEIFSRSKSRNLAAERALADGAEVLVLLDADSLIPLDQVREAVRMAMDMKVEDTLVLPFTSLVSLTEAQTLLMLAGGDPIPENRLAIPRLGPGNCVVVERDVWNVLDGYDERFVGWGGEDSDLLNRAREWRFKVRRVKGRCIHLWHPQSAAGAS